MGLRRSIWCLGRPRSVAVNFAVKQVNGLSGRRCNIMPREARDQAKQLRRRRDPVTEGVWPTSSVTLSRLLIDWRFRDEALLSGFFGSCALRLVYNATDLVDRVACNFVRNLHDSVAGLPE